MLGCLDSWILWVETCWIDCIGLIGLDSGLGFVLLWLCCSGVIV